MEKRPAVKVIMGGMNVGDPYAWSGVWAVPKPQTAYRDTDLTFTGPETAKVIDRFIQAAGHSKEGRAALTQLTTAARTIAATPGAFEKSGPSESSVEFVSNDPKYGKNQRSIEDLYCRLIDETPSGETITFANAYTNFTSRMLDRLVSASRRGVKLHFVVNSPKATDPAAANLELAFRDQLRGIFRRVPAASIQVTEFSRDVRRNESSMHQKIAKFGAKGPVIVGSFNDDRLSSNYNSESVAAVQNHRVGQQFDALINRMAREGETRPVDRKTLGRESLGFKVKAFIMDRVVGRIL